MGLLKKLNLSKLKNEATELISPSPKVDLNNIRWGAIGDFVFGIYSWVEQFSWEDEDEYVDYPTLSGVVEREKTTTLNRKAELTLQLWQRDINEITQNEDEVFEEDLMGTLNALYAEKNKATPLDLIKNNGELLIGRFSINRVEITETETDNKGMPIKLTVKLDLESFPDSQI